MPQSYDELVLAELLLNVAAGFTRKQWYTSTCRDFEALLGRDSRENDLRQLEKTVEAAWDAYYESPVAPEERTAETMVGHRLLVEGLAGWMEAIDLARRGAPPVEAMAAAERANRLLMAVQYQARRLRGTVGRK